MHIAGVGGTRRVRAVDFFRGLFETALQPGEILRGVEIALPPEELSTAYAKFRHPASGYAVAAAAVVLRFEGTHCVGGALAITGVASHAFTAASALQHLAGFSGTPEEIDNIVSAALTGVEPLADRFADAAYRLQLAKTMIRRALASAWRARKEP
jgi:carbon-monoxide dehydrogenase medium subunit